LIDYGVGLEKGGYVTKGVTSLAQFLMLFALEAGKVLGHIDSSTYGKLLAEIRQTADYHESVQSQAEKFYKDHEADLTSMTVVSICGFLQAYGIGCEAALKLGETIKIPSYVYEAEEYIHGPSLQLTPNYTVFLVDDFSVGSERIIDIYKAVKSVGTRVFVVTNSKVVDENQAFRLPFEVGEPTLSPLYILPFFQIIAYKVTEALHRWDKHPLYAEFEKIAQTKTEGIKNVMPDL
jgi:glucoselysine-6-phosphate deglycase